MSLDEMLAEIRSVDVAAARGAAQAHARAARRAAPRSAASSRYGRMTWPIS